MTNEGQKTYTTKDGQSWRVATEKEWYNAGESNRRALISDGALIFVVSEGGEEKTMTSTITNFAQVIDSRDVIERIADLQECEPADLDEDETQELAALLELAEDCDNDEWVYGLDLIRDDHFEEYAQELAEDCGMVPDGLTWPLTCIDWKWAARELQYDYVSIEFDGVTYWLRRC